MVKEDYDDQARLVTFITFGVVGVIGWFVLPRARVARRLCKNRITCQCPPSWKTSLAVFFLDWFNMWFLGYYLTLIILYEIDNNFKDLGYLSRGPNIFMYSFLIGGIASLFFLFLPVLIWSTVVWLLILNIVFAQFYNCEDAQCVGARFLFALVASFALALGFWMVGSISRRLRDMQYYFASSFTVVFSVANSAYKIDYFIDNTRPIYPLVVTTGLSFIRYLWIKARTHLICCGAIDQLSQEYEQVEEEDIREEEEL